MKEGHIPEEWAAKSSKIRQKDRDGRWTLKRGRRKKRPDGSLMTEIATQDEQIGQGVDDIERVQLSFDPDCQALPCALIQDVQRAECLAVVRVAVAYVVRPDMIAALRPQLYA